MMPDVSDIVTRLVKYALEGVAVALAAYFFSGKLKINEIGMISLTAMATFAILDVYAPSVGASARTGAGSRPRWPRTPDCGPLRPKPSWCRAAAKPNRAVAS